MSTVMAPASTAGEQMKTEGEYLVKYFPDITLGDIDWMMELYIHRKLPMEYPPYNVHFTCDFMSKVIDAYRRLKYGKGQRLIEEVEKRQHNQGATPELNLEAMKFMVTEVKRQIDGASMWIHMLGDVYRYLDRTRQLPILSAEEESKLIGFVMEKLGRYRKTAVNNGHPSDLRTVLITPPFAAKDIERAQEQFRQEYILSAFFIVHGLEKVLTSMRVEQFLPENNQ